MEGIMLLRETDPQFKDARQLLELHYEYIAISLSSSGYQTVRF